jgi:hypothetical protein
LHNIAQEASRNAFAFIAFGIALLYTTERFYLSFKSHHNPI